MAAITGQTEGPRRSRTRTIVFWSLAIGIVLPGAYGFTEKFLQFIRTFRSDATGGFTIVPMANYLIVTAGFACLLVWAIAHGMFRDVEKPKFDMLEREAELDAREQAEGRS